MAKTMVCDNCQLQITERFPDPDESKDFCSERCILAYEAKEQGSPAGID